MKENIKIVVENFLKEQSHLNAAFKKWFGNSVVRHGGEPLVVYKGMRSKYWKTGEVIQVINSVNGNWAGYFTDDESVAMRFKDIYGTMGDAKLYRVFLRIELPYIVDAKGRPARDFMLDAHVLEKENNKELEDVLNQRKHDGIIIKNTSDEGTLYIPFEPNQIKSVDNDGSFDINDDNIFS